MRIFLTLLFLFSTTVHAATPEACLNMARDYLVTMDKNNSDSNIIYAREKFMSNCKTDDTFSQALTRLVIDDRAIKAIHLKPEAYRRNTSHPVI